MAKDLTIVRDHVFRAADHLAQKGEKVSVSAVRSLLGLEDTVDVQDLLIAWRDDRRAQLFKQISQETPTPQPAPSLGSLRELEDLPPPIRSLMGHFLRHLTTTWLDCQAREFSADDQISVIRAAAEARVREAEGDAHDLSAALFEAEDRARTLTQERDALLSSLEHVEGQIEIDTTKQALLPGASPTSLSPETEALHHAAAQQIAKLRSERDALIREAQDLRDALLHRRDAQDLLSRPAPSVLAREAGDDTTDEDAEIVVEILSAAQSLLRSDTQNSTEHINTAPEDSANEPSPQEPDYRRAKSGLPESPDFESPDFDVHEKPVFVDQSAASEFDLLGSLTPDTDQTAHRVKQNSDPVTDTSVAEAIEDFMAPVTTETTEKTKDSSEGEHPVEDLTQLFGEPEPEPEAKPALAMSSLQDLNGPLLLPEEEVPSRTAPLTIQTTQDQIAQKERIAEEKLSEMRSRIADLELELQISHAARDQAIGARHMAEKELEDAQKKLRQQAQWITQARSRMEKAGLL